MGLRGGTDRGARAAAPGPGHHTCVQQDGDVQRHLYLQDVLTQVTESPERPR